MRRFLLSFLPNCSGVLTVSDRFKTLFSAIRGGQKLLRSISESPKPFAVFFAGGGDIGLLTHIRSIESRICFVLGEYRLFMRFWRGRLFFLGIHRRRGAKENCFESNGGRRKKESFRVKRRPAQKRIVSSQAAAHRINCGAKTAKSLRLAENKVYSRDVALSRRIGD